MTDNHPANPQIETPPLSGPNVQPATSLKDSPMPTPPKSQIRFPKINLLETQEIIEKLESLTKSKVLSYYTPKGLSINQGHPDIFLEQLRRMGAQEKISLVLISDGGDSSASLRIATVLREYCKELHVIVPSTCASAATVLALSADKIIMCSSGYLTAIDTSLVHGLNPKGPDGIPVPVSVDQVKRIVKFLNEEGPAITDQNREGSYRTLFKYIHPITIGEIDRISSRTILVATKMMKMHPQSFENETKIDWIASHLYNDYPEHGFPILFQEAKDIGLPVEKANMEMTDLLRNLVNYYDSSSRPAITYLSESFCHDNSLTNLVESLGVRTSFRVNRDKRLSSLTKKWQNETDLSSWVNIVPPKNPGEKTTIYPLEILSPQPRKESSYEPPTTLTPETVEAE